MFNYKPCCIDIYHGDVVQDGVHKPLVGFDLVKQDGIYVLIHKASENTNDPDQSYDLRREHWMTGDAITVTEEDGTVLKLAPLWGAYHFFHGQNPAAEAKFFLSVARLQKTDMAFIDWEEIGASGYQPSIDATNEFCDRVEQALGRSCGVYGGNVPRERFASGKPSDAVLEAFEARFLWFCAYGSIKELTLIPEPWKKAGPFLWQDDGDRSGPGPHVIPGMRGYCDNSVIVAPMTHAKLHALWLGEATTSPVVVPPNEEPTPVPPAPETPVAPPPPPPKENLGEIIAAEFEKFKKHIEDEIAGNKTA